MVGGAPQLQDASDWHGKEVKYSYKNTSAPYLRVVAESLGLDVTTNTKGALWDAVVERIDEIYVAQGWSHKLILHNIRVGTAFTLRETGQSQSAPVQASTAPARAARNLANSSNANNADSDYRPTTSSPAPAHPPRRRPPRRSTPPQQSGDSARQQSDPPPQDLEGTTLANDGELQTSNETSNETSVEFLSEEEKATSKAPPFQRTLNVNDLRRMVIAAAHKPFHRRRSHPFAYRSNPGRIASTNLGDLFDGKTHPGISALRINFTEHQTYQVASTGELCAFRGRGPVWDDNSCAFDCVLVAARLLQAGLSPIDYGSPPRETWLASLDPAQRKFLEAAVDHRWDIWTRKQSIAERDRLFRQTLRDYNAKEGVKNQVKRGRFLPATLIWDHHMSSLNQFQFRMGRGQVCTHCHQIISSPAFDIHAHMTPDLRDRDLHLSMQELLQKYFAVLPSRNDAEQHCEEGSVLRRRIIQGTLPERLIVCAPIKKRNTPQATADMTFNYRSFESEEDSEVTYRWLGGIYKFGHHYRVYFTDVPYGDIDGYLQIYDGATAEAAIIGEVLPVEMDNRVPHDWARHTDILFYEKVNRKNYDAVIQGLVGDYNRGGSENGDHDGNKSPHEDEENGEDEGSGGHDAGGDDDEDDPDAEGDSDPDYEVGDNDEGGNYADGAGSQAGEPSSSKKRRKNSSSNGSHNTRSSKKVKLNTQEQQDIDDLFKDSPNRDSQTSPASRKSSGSNKAKQPAASTASPKRRGRSKTPRSAASQPARSLRPRPPPAQIKWSQQKGAHDGSDSSSQPSEESPTSSRRPSLGSRTTATRSSDSRSSSVKLHQRNKRRNARERKAAREGKKAESSHPTKGGKRPPGTGGKGPKGPGGKRPPGGKNEPANSKSPTRRRSSVGHSRDDEHVFGDEEESDDADSDQQVAKSKGKGKSMGKVKAKAKTKSKAGASSSQPTMPKNTRSTNKRKRGRRPPPRASTESSTPSDAWSVGSEGDDDDEEEEEERERKRAKKEGSPWRNLEAKEPSGIGGVGYFAARRRMMKREGGRERRK